jgi:cytochrome c oxidase subunit 1
LRFTDHKVIGLQYFATAMVFLLVGFLLMLLMRWQLAWPTSPLPSVFAAVVGEMNAPGGYMAPEFYNQLVAMHGTVMIFLAVVPLLTGAFGNYLVPTHIGAHEMAFPRLNAASYWIFLAAGVLMLLGFFTEGGAANSGWTSYPPLAVMATRGQDFWLAGIVLLGVSAMLNALNVIVTVVQLRADGMTMMQLPFFVWAQLIAALLLLLAFPSLQAAGILQFLDRVIGTSFFLPSGLVVSGVPVRDISGGGNPLLWQHLFWFLGHPEVYVLILPAIGIVAEIIVSNTGRPLWGYRGMVAAVLFIGVMSMIVWAHHMFLTGMGTTLGTFFQVTTMIISIPSVVLITSLMLSLWGGSIRFTTPMLFALAFLPMFGIGGLSGLPLGLAASDVILHDTWYVVGHFHFLVAPGTLFAIFAGIYYWFPTVTGRTLNHRLGQIHFWGSLFAMGGIFLPMFTLGLRGVNRRLYDAGLQYAHAQGTLGIQEHMTWMAVLLGLAQIPFLLNVAMTLRRGTLHSAAFAHPSQLLSRTGAAEENGPAPFPSRRRGANPGPSEPLPASSTIPWTYSPRHDSRTTNVRMGVWLFLASEAMFFGSLFSAYVLLRAGSAAWPDARAWMHTPQLVILTLLVAIPSMCLQFLTTAERKMGQAHFPFRDRRMQIVLTVGAISGVSFLALKFLDLAAMRPADNLAIACWFVLTGLHWLHVAGGVCATAWVARGAHRRDALGERLYALRLYWLFVDIVWIAILVSFWL